jgi:uncharacterized membrane protein
MDVINQAWLTAAGLALDFLGFCLLLREWWIAFFSEHAQMAHEELLERQQKLRAFSAKHAGDTLRGHLEIAGQMQDDMAIRRARDDRRNAMNGRRRWFIAASILIVVGFLLQLAGAIPN